MGDTFTPSSEVHSVSGSASLREPFRIRALPSPIEHQEVGQLTLNVGDIVWVAALGGRLVFIFARPVLSQVLEEEDGWCGGHKEGDGCQLT